MGTKVCLIGDVHGCLEELKELLDKVSCEEGSCRVIFLGDLIDRGPFSVETLQFVRKNNFECVLGNHEQIHLKYYNYRKRKEKNPDYKIPMRHLGNHKMKIQLGLSDEDFQWISGLPKFILFDEGRWVAVHAGLEPSKAITEQDEDKILHLRFLHPETFKPVSLNENFEPPFGSIYWTEAYDGPHNVIYGHHIHFLDYPGIAYAKSGLQAIGIDTGCVFGGNLTAAIIEDMSAVGKIPKFITVKARQNYYNQADE